MISIFSPTHNPKYLQELYDSIKGQDFYEWVIVSNKGVIVPDFKDERVKVFSFESDYVGALKRFACSKCTGDIYLEVDHDDLLTENAIEELTEAFKDKSVGFVYSNTANFRGDFEKTERYAEVYGWKYRDTIKGLEEHIAFEPVPSAVSRIWYAPNHLRAWRADVYKETGGHNPEMRVLDDQELIAKTYLVTKFKHIDKCLYLYRIDNGNTWLKHNKEIQDNVMRIYEKYIQDIAVKWSKDHNLLCLDLGGSFGCPDGFEAVDIRTGTDLNKKWPYEDGSVGVIRAYDIFEHLKDPIHTMKEVQRVLAPDGVLLSQTPSTDGRGAFQDPTHVSFWNENSFLYYTDEGWGKYIDSPVKLKTIQIYTTKPDDINVCWVRADLVKKGVGPGVEYGN